MMEDDDGVLPQHIQKSEQSEGISRHEQNMNEKTTPE